MSRRHHQVGIGARTSGPASAAGGTRPDAGRPVRVRHGPVRAGDEHMLLWDAGIAPRILADLCASSGGRGMHEAGLALARRSIGDRNVVDILGGPRPTRPTVVIALSADQ